MVSVLGDSPPGPLTFPFCRRSLKKSCNLSGERLLERLGARLFLEALCLALAVHPVLKHPALVRRSVEAALPFHAADERLHLLKAVGDPHIRRGGLRVLEVTLSGRAKGRRGITSRNTQSPGKSKPSRLVAKSAKLPCSLLSRQIRFAGF